MAEPPQYRLTAVSDGHEMNAFRGVLPSLTHDQVAVAVMPEADLHEGQSDPTTAALAVAE